jgi:hypothetical protein
VKHPTALLPLRTSIAAAEKSVEPSGEFEVITVQISTSDENASFVFAAMS